MTSIKIESTGRKGVEQPTQQHTQEQASTGSNLFRIEAMKRHSNQSIGTTTLAVPLSFRWYSAIALSLLGITAAFLIFGSYTATERTTTILQPKSGLIPISHEKGGVVGAIHVREGEHVHKGRPLFAIRRGQSSEGSEESSLSSSESVRSSSSQGILSSSAGSDSAKEEDAGEQLANHEIKENMEDIKSPADGFVYAIDKKVNEKFSDFESVITVAPDSPIIATVDVSAALHARIEVGTPVTLEMSAFKNRVVGKLRGHVTEIRRAPTPKYNRFTGQTSNVYGIVIGVDPASSKIDRANLLGKEVTVDLPIEKRRLYEWLLDPVNSLFD